jgi:hypothetical protein
MIGYSYVFNILLCVNTAKDTIRINFTKEMLYNGKDFVNKTSIEI